MYLEEYLPEIVFMNEEESRLAGKSIDFLIENKKMVVITSGEKGCVVFNNGKSVKYPGFKIKSLDTTGAGDMFMAGFLYGYLNKWDISETALFANACGAIATTGYGARDKIPSVEEADELVNISARRG